MRWRMKKAWALTASKTIFDMEFRRRFSELINRTRGLSTLNRDIDPLGFHVDLFQR